MEIKLKELQAILENENGDINYALTGEISFPYSFAINVRIDLWDVLVCRDVTGMIAVETIHPLKDKIVELLKKHSKPSPHLAFTYS